MPTPNFALLFKERIPIIVDIDQFTFVSFRDRASRSVLGLRSAIIYTKVRLNREELTDKESRVGERS